MDANLIRNGILPFSFPGMPRIRCVFTTRGAGNLSLYRAATGDENREETLAARKTLFNSLGVESWSELQQVHSDAVIMNPEPTALDAEPTLEADGQGTGRKNHALVIKTADCQPILLAHPEGYIGALHVGWRGNVLKFPQTAVSVFCSEYSLDPSELRAVRGPSLGFAEFVNFTREWPASFAPWYGSATRCMDLWSLSRRQLCEAGLKSSNIFSLDLCTYALNAYFFSHRRGDTARQMGVIWQE